MTENLKLTSPRWNNSTKLIATLIIIVALSALLIRFKFLIGPLIFAFILAYLLQPTVQCFQKKLNLPWKTGVNLIYLIFVIVLIGLLIWGGLALLDQIQKLVIFLQDTSETLPASVEEFVQNPIVIGKTAIDLTKIELLPVAQQLLNTVEPLLGKIAEVVGNLAASAANIIVWLLFSILISYFVLHEAAGRAGKLFHFDLPRYQQDIKKMGQQIGTIWNAFLRRQILIFIITILIYVLFLGVSGVKFFFGLALLAGLARFVPYIGPIVVWITYGLVANLQGSTIFGMTPMAYAIVVVVIAILIDYVIDLIVTPRLMADALKLHPGAVMVAALVGLDLFGIIGMILASPLLATFKLLFDYSRYKIQDEDPWIHILPLQRAKSQPNFVRKIWLFFQDLRVRIQKKKIINQKEKTKKRGKENGRLKRA
jgi:predicted PurR-regulated permease PerM